MDNNILRAFLVLQIVLLANNFYLQLKRDMVAYPSGLIFKIGMFLCMLFILFADITTLPLIMGMIMVIYNFSMMRLKMPQKKERTFLQLVFFFSFLYFVLSFLYFVLSNRDCVLSIKKARCNTHRIEEKIIPIDNSVFSDFYRITNLLEGFIYTESSHSISNISVTRIERQGNRRIYSVYLQRKDMKGILQRQMFVLNVDLETNPNRIIGENPFKRSLNSHK